VRHARGGFASAAFALESGREVSGGCCVTPPRTDEAPCTDGTRWFTDEVQPHALKLKSYLRGSFPQVRDVDDVVQESFLRVWRAHARHPIQSAKAFLFQVARRLAIDAVRHARVSPVQTGRDSDMLSVLANDPDAANTVTQQERKRHLVETVASLPNRYREIVILRKFEELPQRVVAEQLGLSERTVENLLARALKKVETKLRSRGVFELYEP
jgi:RNA polymerase sigma factor (sigma-70 family)